VAEGARPAAEGGDAGPGAAAVPPAGGTRPAGPRIALPVALAPLRHRNYRLLWIGTLISQSGEWMDQIALNWLVYQLTGSAFSLALVNLCRLTPILLFTLVGGVIADRVERRKLMFATQTAAMALALILAVLVSTGLVELWMVLLVAVGRGVAMSFNLPARQSLISDLVPRELLSSAIALNQATNNLTRVFGPAIGGLLIASIGVAGAFYVNGFSFLAVLYGLALMRFPPREVRQKQGILTDLIGGLRYIQGEPSIRTLVVLALVPMILGMPYMTMLTVFASDVLRVGTSGLGLLTACSGAGAVCGALFVASRGAKRGRRRLMRIGLVGFGATLLIFALSPWLWLSAGTLIAVGFSQQVYNAQNNALVQEEVDPEYRGRVVSTLFLNRGLVPLGTALAGFGTDLWGAQMTLGTMAGLLVLLAVFVTGRRLVATAPRPAV
jgi:MFS family permease